MSSATGLKTTDGQRLSPRLAAICATSTPSINLVARRPADPLRATLAQVFAGFALAHRGDATSRDVEIPGPAGPLAARLYEPADLPAPSPLIVYFHGGGWVFGDLTSHDGACRFLARRANARVLAVDYRLAPETAFPGAFDDAVAALAWSQVHAAELGADPARIGVGGDSAGGNLAVAAALHAETRPAFALLIYPLTDADLERHASTRLFAKGPLLTRQGIRDFVGHYAPSPRQQLDPRVSVIDHPGLEAMPPTFVATAGMDPLRDQGEAFAAKLQGAGVSVEVQRFENLPHGFFNVLAEPQCRAAAEQVAAAAARGLA